MQKKKKTHVVDPIVNLLLCCIFNMTVIVLYAHFLLGKMFLKTIQTLKCTDILLIFSINALNRILISSELKISVK